MSELLTSEPESHTAKILRWRRELAACPKAYAVWVRCDGEESLNGLYDNEEAANLERDWYNARNRGGYLGKAFVRAHHVATLELARERFR